MSGNQALSGDHHAVPEHGNLAQGHMEAVAAEQAAAESDRDMASLFVLPAAGTPAERSLTHSVGATVGSVWTPAGPT